MAEAFIPNPDKLPTVDHINRNRMDNRIDNFRWANYSTQNSNKDMDKITKNLGNYSVKGKRKS